MTWPNLMMWPGLALYKFLFQNTKNPQNSGYFPISWPSKYNKSIKNEALKTYETDIFFIQLERYSMTTTSNEEVEND